MSERREIYSIQALRGYAALSVLLGHSVLEVAATNGFDAPFETKPLLYGVDIFFVISGFVMLYTAGDQFGRPGATLNFWWRRFIRIAPLYWLFTTLMVAALLFFAVSVRATEMAWEEVAYSYLFWPDARDSGRIAPVLSLGWTLNYEMFFYLIFGLILLLGRRAGVFALLASLSVLAIAGASLPWTWSPWVFWSNPIVLEFGFGVLIAAGASRLQKNSSVALSLSLIIGGFVSLFVLPNYPVHRVLAGGLSAAAILVGCVTLPKQLDVKIHPVFVLLGAASFALYLSHRFVLRLTTILLERKGFGDVLEFFIYPAFTMVIGVATAIFVYWLIEMPLLNLLRPKKVATGSASAG